MFAIKSKKLLALKHGYCDPEDNYEVEVLPCFAQLGSSIKERVDLFINFYHLDDKHVIIKHVNIKNKDDFDKIEFSYFLDDLSLFGKNKWVYINFIFINDYNHKVYFYSHFFKRYYLEAYLDPDESEGMREYYRKELSLSLKDFVRFYGYDEYFKRDVPINYDKASSDSRCTFFRPDFWFAKEVVYFGGDN